MTKKLLSVLLFLMGTVQTICAQEPYAALSNDNTTLTFYYDNQKEARGGMSVGPFENNSSWYDQRLSITSVVFDESFAACTTITSTRGWFSSLQNLTSITGLDRLNTANVTDMRSMFHRCTALTSLDVSTLNTAKVERMQDMFSSCQSLTSLDLSNFNTANVWDMQEMFENCRSLTTLDLSSFNTANVTQMGSMFEQCKALTSLNVHGFNTTKVTDMNEMFRDCSSLTSLVINNFITTNVKDMGQMFDGCTALTSLDLSSFDMTNVTDVRRMFYECSSLTTIYAYDGWNCSKSTNMFFGCTSLKGAIAYDETKTDITYANPTTGYFTLPGQTAISAIDAANGQRKGEARYNLGGQRLSQPQRGINIVDGKKVVVK